MAKRVFEIAKELGIKSKVVVDKCHAEGIPDSVIKGHMSTVSAGLEATIREWFSTESGGTAIEESEKVNLESARAKPKKAKAASRADDQSESDGGGAAVQTAEPPAAPDRTGADADRGDDEPAEEVTEPAGAPEKVPSKPEPGRAAARVPAGLSTTPPEREAPVAKAPVPAAAAEASEPDAAEQADREDDGNLGEQRAAAAQSDAQRGSDGDAAVSEAAGSPGATGAEGGATGAEGEEPAASSSRGGSPQMNVPNRPKVISPAGPTIHDVKKEQIKLSGPRVVRVEQPEQVDLPRRGPRFGPGGPNRGPRTGGGVVPAGDDSGRSPRRGRNDRGGSGSPETGWSDRDLAERQARLERSGGYLRSRRKALSSGGGGQQAATPAQVGGKVSIAEPFTIKDLSAATGVKATDIIKKLFLQGVMANINSAIDTEKAQEVMMDYEIELDVQERKTAEQAVKEQFSDRQASDERPRGPVVTILGHVDHGKTSLLDKIRNANVASGEAGGITQATSAFRVPVNIGDDERQVVFIDTPGHEAFTAMRARGASVTDIVVLVVAADDGVMPQTVESISHAKAAGVPIIVALNKIDKPEATDSNIQKILGQLAEQGLNPTDWGGDTEVVRTSAVKNEGVQDLLEILDLQSQVLEMKADFGGPARGTVIEARPEEGRGAVANILVQDGELAVGDFIVMGRAFGRVRDITDDRGKKLKGATPPMPVQISGIDLLPDAGDKFYVVETLRQAEQAAEQRRDRERREQLAQPKVTLDSLFGQMADQDLKNINIVLKADVQGSVDVLRSEVEKVSNEEVKVRVLHAAVGGVTESDVLLAQASKAIIVGFNVIPSGKARRVAEAKGVEIRQYQVIYDIVDDVKKAAEGMLAPELRQEILGHAEVRQVFRVSKVGMIAGCYVTDGTIVRDAFIRVTRNDIIIENGRRLEQLKRFKDDAREVRSGLECGMKIVGYDDIKDGDILECYKQIEVKRTLS